ncbi:Pectinesterase QRT1 [Citrus sinensis]|uniref:Pectinesterase QRT1 n=1 Tax=Citrus sinensis TaxID=2711 RepID=A0ACB8P2G7_CITSI|nr:Pectinesterase QRT1 [Citrus sinensis]
MGRSAFLVAFAGFLLIVQVSLSQHEAAYSYRRNFITWDDLKVDWQKAWLDTRESVNRTRLIIVDKNGGGHSSTVQGAVDLVPENNSERVKIYILPGVYREKVTVPQNKPYISFIGHEQRASETVISWHNKASDKDSNGIELGTYKSASVSVFADFFCATGITFADTLLDDTGSHYFYQCHIQGSIDFIFGRARSLYQDCVLQSIAEKSGAIAAHHRDIPDDSSGFSFVNCVINGTGKIYLGRAWGNYSRIIYSYSYLEDIIYPTGWSDWNMPYRDRTVVFGEYQCSGKGADRSHRPSWLKSLSYEEVQPFLNVTFIDGKEWLRL